MYTHFIIGSYKFITDLFYRSEKVSDAVKRIENNQERKHEPRGKLSSDNGNEPTGTDVTYASQYVSMNSIN